MAHSIASRARAAKVRPAIYAVVAFVCFAVTAMQSSAASVPESLLPLVINKEEIARKLTAPIARCVSRRDSGHFAFRGCIDWHSAVHGVWALLAYTRATGDRKYENLLSELLSVHNVQAEHDLIRDRKKFEMPYGRAWFLRLAIEYKRLYGGDLLARMADDVLESLVVFYKANIVDPNSMSYDSASWALFNMYDYAKSVDNQPALEFIIKVIRERFVLSPDTCNNASEVGNFMAVCTNWALTVSRVLPRGEFGAWANDFFAKSGLPEPIKKPVKWHPYGLNFSRAWGLWELYSQTGKLEYADAFAAHFQEGYSDPEKWQGSYEGVAHWVPQFGMFAIQPLFGNRGR